MVKAILPRQNTLALSSQPTQATDATAAIMEETPQPRRRGRKPGPLSRSAREAQRKLNHSIIEKARRTKINEALAALRQLVPADYGKRRDQECDSAGGQPGEPENDDEDDEEDDGDGEYGAPQRKAVVANKKNATGKKEEKEFKLEVLERTVAYLQDLAERYEGLQKEHGQLLNMRRCRCCEGEDAASRKRRRSDAEIPSSNSVDNNSQKDERPSKRHESLPSISSLLSLSPETVPHAMDVFPPGSRHTTNGPLLPPYLPTPPSSARFRPTQTPVSPISMTTTKSSQIPSLSLGPTALPLPSSIPEGNNRRHSVSRSSISSASSNDSARPYIKPQRLDVSPAFPSSPSRTREDETAASLLLTLRSPTSPRHPPTTSPLLHMSSSSSRRQSISHIMSPPSLALPLPERLTAIGMPKRGDCERECVSPTAYVSGSNKLKGSQQVETPGSLLGLTVYRNRN